MKKINVAFVGVGSNTSAMIQVIEKSKKETGLNGVRFSDICGYTLDSVNVVAAFDVDQAKIGKDIADAIFSDNNACKKYVDIEKKNVIVDAGPLFDGVEGNLSKKIEVSEESKKNNIECVVKRLKDSKADVVVANLPTGSAKAIKEYAFAAARAGVAFVNATPELAVRDPEVVAAFEYNRVPLLGDDLRSHLGATTLHMVLIELFRSRGIEVTNTYQLNFGGNMDFYNLTSPGRALSKQESKRNSLFAAGIDASNVTAGPNGYIEYLQDNKICYLHLEGKSILDSDISIELKLSVQDSANAAGVLASAIRIAVLAKERGLYGVIDPVCAYLFKSPRKSLSDREGTQQYLEFIGEKGV